MPWFLLYAWMAFHSPQTLYKAYPQPPAFVQPAPTPPSFACRIIKYPTKGDPTTISVCP